VAHIRCGCKLSGALGRPRASGNHDVGFFFGVEMVGSWRTLLSKPRETVCTIWCFLKTHPSHGRATTSRIRFGDGRWKRRYETKVQESSKTKTSVQERVSPTAKSGEAARPQERRGNLNKWRRLFNVPGGSAFHGGVALIATKVAVRAVVPTGARVEPDGTG
jgi:hypothetical protein